MGPLLKLLGLGASIAGLESRRIRARLASLAAGIALLSIAVLAAVAAGGFLLVSLYLGLATVMHPAGAAAITGGLCVLIALLLGLSAKVMLDRNRRRPRSTRYRPPPRG